MPAEDRPTADRNGASLFGRVALVLLTLYALAMVAPDFLRVVRPLGSFGLATNGDGLIYDVQGPFASEEDSPAWRAGLRVGDRLDLAAMRCMPVDTDRLREHSVAIGRRELRRAGPRGDAYHRRDRRAPGARSQARCGAAPRQSPVRGHRRARHDRRHPGGARRGVAGVDASRSDDLGLLRLCDPVQSRPGVPDLGVGPALAVGASGARLHCAGDAGRRLYRAPAVCAEGAARPD